MEFSGYRPRNGTVTHSFDNREPELPAAIYSFRRGAKAVAGNIKPREKPAVRQVGAISFLRGPLINHDTQPITSNARSKPFAPELGRHFFRVLLPLYRFAWRTGYDFFASSDENNSATRLASQLQNPLLRKLLSADPG